jgi:hypothetical protein
MDIDKLDEIVKFGYLLVLNKSASKTLNLKNTKYLWDLVYNDRPTRILLDHI